MAQNSKMVMTKTSEISERWIDRLMDDCTFSRISVASMVFSSIEFMIAHLPDYIQRPGSTFNCGSEYQMSFHDYLKGMRKCIVETYALPEIERTYMELMQENANKKDMAQPHIGTTIDQLIDTLQKHGITNRGHAVLAIWETVDEIKRFAHHNSDTSKYLSELWDELNRMNDAERPERLTERPASYEPEIGFAGRGTPDGMQHIVTLDGNQVFATDDPYKRDMFAAELKMRFNRANSKGNAERKNTIDELRTMVELMTRAHEMAMKMESWSKSVS